MKIKKNGFSLVKDEFFQKFKEKPLPYQKNGRPIYYCIQYEVNKKYF